MSRAETVFQHAVYEEQTVSKVNNFTGQDLTANTYYFKPSQTMGYRTPASGDEVFVVLQGQGQFILNNGQEEKIDVETGSIMYIPRGVQYKISSSGTGEMICTGVCHPPH